MGLRQHPGPLAKTGFAVLAILLAGCTLSSLPVTSLLESQSAPSGTIVVGLKLPARGSPPLAAPASAPVHASPLQPSPSPSSPLGIAMQRAGSYYERGLQAMRSGNADQAEWEFDAALETLLDMNLNGQAPTSFLITARLPQFPPSQWLSGISTPQRSLTPEPPETPEPDEPTLEAPALLSPEDQQAVTRGDLEDASTLPEVDTQKFDVPIVYNDQVKAFIQYFQFQKWGVITRAFERARRYLPMMRKIFRDKGLPEDLLNLAFIESAVNPRATSRAKAAGIWQFIPSTGRLYGMQSSRWLDERRDPEKSTRGAAEYLRNLYRMFDSWPLALAAYNAGEGKLQGSIQRQRTRDFWSLRLPKETQLFVPAFMAMTIIAREPERYGFSPPPEEPHGFEYVSLPHPIDLKLVAQAAGTTVDHIRELNPELIRWVTPPDVTGYTLRIPAGRRGDFLEALDRIPSTQWVTWTRHRVRKGETPSSIAKRYGADLQMVLEINGLRKRQGLKPGVTLFVPPSPALSITAGVKKPGRAKQATANVPVPPKQYTVKRGDTLVKIARAQAVSPEDLRRWNNLSRDARLRPGRILRMSPLAQAAAPLVARPRNASDPGKGQAPPMARRYVVKRGDTLWNIARAQAVSPEDLRRWNSLPRDGRLRPGQELLIQEPSS